ncbi:MAG: XRE family transcriptional regulator [Pedobacter sp.]|nr:MAG: XRE family transcriptional regulator [Pedobacter sp.]
MKKVVISKIKKIRLEKNFSQQYMASQLQISQSYYAKIEKGHKELTFNWLVQLSKIFNITPTLFFEELLSEHHSHSTKNTTID